MLYNISKHLFLLLLVFKLILMPFSKTTKSNKSTKAANKTQETICGLPNAECYFYNCNGYNLNINKSLALAKTNSFRVKCLQETPV